MPGNMVEIPADACDTHAHIFGPAEQYAYSTERLYTPPDHSPAEYAALLAALGIRRGVLVQPSVYGTDNRALVAALRSAGPRYRGVVAVDPSVDDRELEALHQANVRGVRINLVDVPRRQPGHLPIETIRSISSRISRLGWHVELLLHVDEFPDLDRMLRDLDTDVVIAHFGYPRSGCRSDSPGFLALLRLLRAGRAWVKMTAPYRISSNSWPFPDVRVLVSALLRVAPERILWGTDWPHVKTNGNVPADAEWLTLFLEWLRDRTTQRQVLVVNPAALYWS